MKKKKAHPKLRLRHTWVINPKTRVKRSKKIYYRAEEKVKARKSGGKA